MSFFRGITFSLLVLGWFWGSTAPLRASETRVEATGNLRTILDDETNDLSLFLDGNPAGLSLLNTRTRLDLAAQWGYSDQEGPWGSNKQQFFSSIPRLSDQNPRYEGLMVFPDSHWAFQVAGDFLSNQGVPVTFGGYSADTQSNGQYRSLLRAAYALPFMALGVEIMDIESDKNFDAGLYNPYVGLASGTSNQNQVIVKAGLATTFPEPSSPDSPRWQAGGYFSAQLGSSVQNQDLNLFYANSPTFDLSQDFNTTDSYSTGAELFYEVPERVKIRFAANFTDWDIDLGQTVPYSSTYFANVSKFRLTEFQSMMIDGGFRVTTPFSGEENLKIGGNLSAYFNNTDLLHANQVAFNDSNRQQIGTQFGIGLDDPKEYTFGLQWKSLDYVTGNQSLNSGTASATPVDTGYDLYQLAFGGERWLAPTWAFRLGLVLENDIYSGGGPNVLVTTINTGVGLEQFFGRVDFRVWLGQTTDVNNSSNTVGFIGSQLSTTIFL